MNKFAAYIGERFRAFETSTLASLDGKFATMRRDFISSVRSKASEIANREVENRIAHEIDKALAAHRQERIALARRVEELADQIERMKQGYQS
ncbi:hypothetical protein IB262_21220 [Ensifer sp. ENS02]|uniref:hypothetical protein n=1 Tax=Ensifer sp. ENS02 TaxID=2769290 RepID=UPI0017816143|nr:hypothetical protein [Ensifer sp. ENS02]MBD9522420.1 hypothetical protein [Ensifer sp. ENS02]